MHVLCMATKTISLKLEAYERLRRARLRADESFSEVVLRAMWPGMGTTASELREVYRRHGAHFTDEELDGIADAKRADSPPEDKWTTG